MPIEPRLTMTAAPALLCNLACHTANCLEAVRLATTRDVTGYAARVGVPALIAWGARDQTVPVRHAEILHRLLPRSALHVSRTGSHDWLVEEATGFAAALARFVDEH